MTANPTLPPAGAANEPVAWTIKDLPTDIWLDRAAASRCAAQIGSVLVPLYAHPPSSQVEQAPVDGIPRWVASPEPSEAEVEAAVRELQNWAEGRGTRYAISAEPVREALRAAYALRSTPQPAEAPSDGFTAEASQAPVGTCRYPNCDCETRFPTFDHWGIACPDPHGKAAPVGTTAQTMAGDYERINGTSARPRFSSINPPLSEEPQRAADQRQRFMEAAAPGMRAAGAVGDKDRAERVASLRELASRQVILSPDYITILATADAHERDGQTIADLTRKVTEADVDKRRLDNVIAETQQNRNQYATAVVDLRRDLAKAEAALVSIRSQVEAETTERIVAWLRGSAEGRTLPPVRFFGARHVADAIERADHLKVTQLPPTGTNESEGK